jgi:hypothetical protein
MTAPDKWFLVPVRCPNCGAPPAYRISEADRDSYHIHPPETHLRSMTCQVGWCRTRYIIRAEDLANAIEDERSA